MDLYELLPTEECIDIRYTRWTCTSYLLSIEKWTDIINIQESDLSVQLKGHGLFERHINEDKNTIFILMHLN